MMNRKESAKRGFTLIELLVVIAIIGILAAIVLVSLSSARAKGKDAGVQGNLDGVRSQMELYAGAQNNSYASGCSAAATATILAGAASASGTTVNTANGAGAYNKVSCEDSASGWAAEAPLSASASGAPVMWCVDSSGKALKETTNLGAGVTVCT